MKDANYELSYLQACLEEIEAYLLSKELFWPVTTPSPLALFPKLTVGNLLLSLNKLKGYSGSGQLATIQRSKYARLERQTDAFRRRWAVAWKTKAAHEFQSRLRQWTHYLNDTDLKVEAHAPFYSSEVRIRALLELLHEYAPEDHRSTLDKMDIILRGRFKPGEFIWVTGVQSAFPQKNFWFLYGSISTE